MNESNNISCKEHKSSCCCYTSACMKIPALRWQLYLWMLVTLLKTNLIRPSFQFSLAFTNFSSRNRCQHLNWWKRRTTASAQPAPHSMTTFTEPVSPIPVKMAAEGVKQSSEPENCHATANDSQVSAYATIASSAKVVSASALAACGERLRAGKLVAFPTETVYGLGCHALEESAVLKVFRAKERPLSDPLIVHVLTADEAFELWNVSPESVPGQVLQRLCQAFWPGPLTLVAPAASHVPPCVTAGTEYVACRSPSHRLARELLRHAQVPLGAPSANKFGHVSPTTAEHVWNDLQHEDVWIVEDDSPQVHYQDSAQGLPNPLETGCNVGVESTVAKLQLSDGESQPSVRLQVLRQGKVSAQDLDSCLRHADLPVAVETIQRATAEDAINVAPGQTLRHYSPHIPSYLVSTECSSSSSMPSSQHAELLRHAVVIDYGGRLLAWKQHAHDYRDLSPSGESARAARVIFETLRWAEQQPVSRILFPDLDAAEFSAEDALLLAVKDRLTRAASGVVLASLEEIQTREQ